MAKEYITWKEFTNKVEEIAKRYIGVCNKKAYGDIARDIQEYIDNLDSGNFCSELKSLGGMVSLDTTEHNEEYISSSSNIGDMSLFEYHIEWKLDKRNNNPTGTILNITFEDKAPEEFSEWYLADIPQGVHYILAKQRREEHLRKIAEYEEMIASYKEGVSKFEDIMRTESWDKSMLFSDLKEV